MLARILVTLRSRLNHLDSLGEGLFLPTQPQPSLNPLLRILNPPRRRRILHSLLEMSLTRLSPLVVVVKDEPCESLLNLPQRLRLPLLHHRAHHLRARRKPSRPLPDIHLSLLPRRLPAARRFPGSAVSRRAIRLNGTWYFLALLRAR